VTKDQPTISGKKNPSFQHPNYMSDQIFYTEVKDTKEREGHFQTQYKASSNLASSSLGRDPGFKRENFKTIMNQEKAYEQNSQQRQNLKNQSQIAFGEENVTELS